MKKQLAVLSLAVAGLCAGPSLLRADDAAVPPKPPGGDKAPADASKAPNATPGRGGARMTPEERLKRLTEELGLSQEQQDKIKAIYEKDAPQMKELMAKGRENLTDDDKTKFRELIKNQMGEIVAVLTPDQKAKFQEMMEKRRAGRGAGNGTGTGGSK